MGASFHEDPCKNARREGAGHRNRPNRVLSLPFILSITHIVHKSNKKQPLCVAFYIFIFFFLWKACHDAAHQLFEHPPLRVAQLCELTHDAFGEFVFAEHDTLDKVVVRDGGEEDVVDGGVIGIYGDAVLEPAIVDVIDGANEADRALGGVVDAGFDF